MITKDVLSFIGNTPILEVTKIDTGHCSLFLKLENQNPGGSIKDRIGISMIEAAEKEGRLQPGSTIIEATAGNTGLGLALVASQKGYKMIIVLPDKMSREKIFNLKAMGAEVIITRSDVSKGHPEYYQDLAESISKKTGAFYVNQFANMANVQAHETSTGPEIWTQLDKDVDAIVCGVGSGGTLTGLSNYFKKVSPKTEIILADPVGSILKDYVKTGSFGEVGSWIVEGIGEDFIPPIADLSRVKHAYSISDQEAAETAREVLKKQGILAGSSSGTLISAALRYCREQTQKKRVVTFVCDTGNKYLSKIYDDYWMVDQGLLKRKKYGDLRDYVNRRNVDQAFITADLKESLSDIHKKMMLHDFSQLPITSGGKLIGMVTESRILESLSSQNCNFKDAVSTIITTPCPTIDSKDTFEKLLNMVGKPLAAVVVMDGSHTYGLVTANDILKYLHQNQC